MGIKPALKPHGLSQSPRPQHYYTRIYASWKKRRLEKRRFLNSWYKRNKRPRRVASILTFNQNMCHYRPNTAFCLRSLWPAPCTSQNIIAMPDILLYLHCRYIQGGPMHTTIQKWGNSLALRIPRAFVRESRLSDKAVVDISVTRARSS